MDLDQRIDSLLPRAVDRLSALVRAPSVLGDEAGALSVLQDEWESLGFTCIRVEVPADIARDPAAGVPRRTYDGRSSLVGARGSGGGARSLLINGHIDVVPAGDVDGWSSPPFEPALIDGWLHGRGAGDMKCGFAAGLLAMWALDDARPGWLRDGRLTMVAAIEEECTGNGTLSTVLAGFGAEAAVLLEPTDLELLLAGIGIIWVAIEVDGLAGHAEAGGSTVNPIVAALPVVAALQRFEAELNEPHDSGRDVDPAFAAAVHPYNVNVGALHAGDWASSTPSIARMEVRIGFPRAWTAAEAFDRVGVVVGAAVKGDPWLRDHPLRLRLSGFRAEGYAQPADGPLVEALVAGHRDVFGEAPPVAVTAATTDARFYRNQLGIPVLAYGPRTRNIHGLDEAVEIASIADTARVIARLLCTWFGAAA